MIENVRSNRELAACSTNAQEFGAFAEHIGIRLVEWESDRPVIEFDFTDQNLNGTGVIHGGCLATKLDTDTAHSAIYYCA